MKKKFSGSVGNPDFVRSLDFDWDLWNLISIFRHHHHSNIRLLNSRPVRCKHRRRVRFSDFK
jgi:hypothetical protein